MSKKKNNPVPDAPVKEQTLPAAKPPDTAIAVDPPPPPKPVKPHFLGIDILKIIAAFFVVGVHTFLYDGFYYTPIHESDTWMIVPIAMRWLYYCCVPIFMTVTG